MDKKIREILAELYEIDPNLREHEERLFKLLAEMIKAKPEIKLDKNFAQDLRVKLIEQSSALNTSSNSFFMKKFSYFLSGAVVVAVLAVGAYVYSPFGFKTSEILSSRISINKVGSEAFGKLVSESSPAFGRGGGGGGQIVATDLGAAPENTVETVAKEASSITPAVAAEGEESAVASDTTVNSIEPAPAVDVPAKMIAPYEYYNYAFKYEGDPVTLSDEKVDVLKRVKGDYLNKKIFGWLDKIDLGLIDLGAFKNRYVQSISVMEDREYGYSIYTDFIEETVSISQNWTTWPSCADDACWTRMQAFNTDIKNVPADEKIIAIADEFVKKYNVDMSGYDTPEIDDYWKAEFERAIAGSYQPYVPDTITVRYPLLVNDKNVYFDTGSKVGLEVSVNIRENRVSGLWNLSSQNYESSQYDAITDGESLIKLAEEGGWQQYPLWEDPNATGTKILTIGTPEEAYVKVFNYTGNVSTELLVPALVFPITEKSADPNYSYKKAIVIPLAKEILENLPEPLYRIMESSFAK